MSASGSAVHVFVLSTWSLLTFCLVRYNATVMQCAIFTHGIATIKPGSFKAITHINSLTSRTLFCTTKVFWILSTWALCCAKIHGSLYIGYFKIRQSVCNQASMFLQVSPSYKSTGAVIQYISVSIALWWLFYITRLCYKLKFALFSKVKWNITCICVHIMLIILC